jgi:uncharacterized protein YjbJ (UPF0337 family)
MSATVKSTDGVSVPNMETINAVPNDAVEILGTPMIKAMDAIEAQASEKPDTHETETTKDMLAERWQELKGSVQARWGELTDDDIEHLSGSTDELAGILQQRYGFAKAKFEAEIAEWLLGDRVSPRIEDQLPKLPVIE